MGALGEQDQGAELVPELVCAERAPKGVYQVAGQLGDRPVPGHEHRRYRHRITVLDRPMDGWRRGGRSVPPDQSRRQ